MGNFHASSTQVFYMRHASHRWRVKAIPHAAAWDRYVNYGFSDLCNKPGISCLGELAQVPMENRVWRRGYYKNRHWDRSKPQQASPAIQPPSPWQRSTSQPTSNPEARPPATVPSLAIPYEINWRRLACSIISTILLIPYIYRCLTCNVKYPHASFPQGEP